jgi:hypothetical protein
MAAYRIHSENSGEGSLRAPSFSLSLDKQNPNRLMVATGVSELKRHGTLPFFWFPQGGDAYQSCPSKSNSAPETVVPKGHGTAAGKA